MTLKFNSFSIEMSLGLHKCEMVTHVMSDFKIKSYISINTLKRNFSSKYLFIFQNLQSYKE
jgi:hypothetical protein